MSTGRWSELSSEHEVRYTGNGKSFTIKMSRTSRVELERYGLVGGGVRYKAQTGVVVGVIT
jgi:hypothetical protein